MANPTARRGRKATGPDGECPWVAGLPGKNGVGLLRKNRTATPRFCAARFFRQGSGHASQHLLL